MDDNPGFSLIAARGVFLFQVVLVAAFWIPGAIFTEGGRTSAFAEEWPSFLTVGVGAAVMFLGLGISLFFRHRMLRAVEQIQSTQDIERSDVLRIVIQAKEDMRSAMIKSQAALKFPTLITAMYFMMVGGRLLLPIAAAVYVTGFVLIFPRAEWLGEAT